MHGTFSRRFSFLTLLGGLLIAAGCAQQTVPTVNKSYAFWPPFPDQPHVLYLASYSRNTDVEPSKSKFADLIYGEEKKDRAGINHPYGVAMWKGCIYVCDTQSPLVEILDLRKHQMRLMGAVEAGKLAKPVAIAIADDGYKYVADDVVGSIAVFDPNDRLVSQIGHEHFRPVCVAVHGNELYATDYKANRIEVFDRMTGKTLRNIATPGIKKGQVVGPLGLAVDGEGNIYVDDILGCRVQKFTPAGKPIGQFGSVGDLPGNFVRPKHIAVDAEGKIYVVDASFANVQVFDREFHPLTYFGTAGTHPGAMDLPAGICVNEGDLDLFADRIPEAFAARRLIVVTNQFGDHKVSIYAEGSLKPGHTLAELSGSRGVVPSALTNSAPHGPGAPLPTTAGSGGK